MELGTSPVIGTTSVRFEGSGRGIDEISAEV